MQTYRMLSITQTVIISGSSFEWLPEELQEPPCWLSFAALEFADWPRPAALSLCLVSGDSNTEKYYLFFGILLGNESWVSGYNPVSVTQKMSAVNLRGKEAGGGHPKLFKIAAAVEKLQGGTGR